jgi:hypothetical protein
MKIRPFAGFIIILLALTVVNATTVFGTKTRPFSQVVQFPTTFPTTLAPDFAISVFPSSQTVSQGQSATYQVTVTSIDGFTSGILLSASGISSVTYSWSANPISPPSNGQAQSTLIVGTSVSTSSGTYSITVVGSSGTLFHTSDLSLSINAVTTQPDFTILVYPSSQTISPGQSASYAVALTSAGGFGSPVSLSATGLPADAISNFGPQSVTPPGNSELTITVPSSTVTIATTTSYTIVVTGVGGGISHSSSVTLYVVSQVAVASWTFMVFMNGDNNLESYLASELDQMEMVGSTSAVNIIVLFAKSSTNDARVYYVAKGSLTTEADWGSTDMGNPQSLQRFIVYVAANFPAQHYALVLNDHGGGFQGVSQDFLYGYDLISMSGLKTALGNGGIHFDLIAFDACLMAMVEVAYQIRGYGDYMTSSPEEELVGAWNYRGVLGDLVNDPQISGRELSMDVVQEYSQGQFSSWAPATQSAIDLSRVGDVVSAVNVFARVLTNDLSTYKNRIQVARNNVDSSEDHDFAYYVDLYDFASLIQQDSSVPDVNLKSASVDVMNAVNNAVIVSWHGILHSHSHGLYIYFDKSALSYAALTLSYRSLDFTSQSTWNGFLLAYLT